MNRIPSGVVFHCDGTYKVVKLEYPLIVFGVSDINRKFYPIAFMFTSHEMNGDYVSFFKSLKELAVMLNIACDPRYIVIDASRAMVYAIRCGDADYELAVVHEPIHEILEARIIEIPKKRGRPPKVSSALKIDSTQTVTVNTVNTVLRRSKRNK